MYEGRTNMQPGRTLGHEPMGQVMEVGKAVSSVKVGDWVCMPFNVSCGTCKNCEKGLTGFCLRANPGVAGAAYGFAGMGPWAGGQAEYLRVPWADFNCLELPADAPQKNLDYVMLADIFPTGYHATEMAGVLPGESVVIYGAGPVGLMAALSATLRGASKVMVVDPPPRPAQAGRADRRRPHRLLQGSGGRSGPPAHRWPGRRSRLRVRGLSGRGRQGERAVRPDDEQPRAIGAGDGRDRRRRGVPPRGSRLERSAGEEGEDRPSTGASSGSRASAWPPGRPT